VHKLLAKDYQLTFRIMANELNVNKESTRSIITMELGKRKNCAKFMTYSLHDEEKLRWLDTYKDFVQTDVGFTYQMIDEVQNKPKEVQYTPSSESFHVYQMFVNLVL
jgi:hypothetical protein